MSSAGTKDVSRRNSKSQGLADNQLAFESHTLRSHDKALDLRYGIWRSPDVPLDGLKRFVVLFNGRTEWIEKYKHLSKDFSLPEDCGFLTFDHRGQGVSGGARAHISSYNTYALDAQKILKEVTSDRPYVIVGHSMGGLIALYGTMLGLLKPSRLGLCSPLLGLPDRPLPRFVSRPLTRMLQTLRLSPLATGAGRYQRARFERNVLTHHPEHFNRIRRTPYPIGSATIGWIAASYEACDTVFEEELLKELKIPTLVLGGTAERVVEFDAMRRWVGSAAKNSSADIRLTLIPGARHELLAEIDKYYQPSLAHIKNWFKPFLESA